MLAAALYRRAPQDRKSTPGEQGAKIYFCIFEP
jgi:hypothetical protein